MAIKNKIKEIRKSKGLTQGELARLIEQQTGIQCGPANISRIENGTRGLTQIWLDRLASALGVTRAELLGESVPGDAAALREVPVIDFVQAGAFAHASNAYPKGHGGDTIHVPYRHARLFAVTVMDQSMNLEFPEGIKIIVDYTDKDLTDREHYLIRYRDETLLKQYRASPARFEARSSVPGFDTIFPNFETIFSQDKLGIIGRIVLSVKRY